MKLVLLPGMDGTGNLFSPLLSELSEFQCQVIPLPQVGPQDYLTITDTIKKALPNDDFILIAESFSGPIAMNLAKEDIKNMKAIIFVATFLSAPSTQLISLAKNLPLKFLSSLPLSQIVQKTLFLGSGASDQLVQLFQSTVSSLPSAIIKARLNSIHSLTPNHETNELPAGYVRAASDKLVSLNKAIEFQECFENIIIKTVEGPHFVLQANPAQCALAITELVHLLTVQGRLTAEIHTD